MNLNASAEKIVKVDNDMSEITLMLGAIAKGKKQASEDLLKLVYGELRRLAAVRMAHEAAG